MRELTTDAATATGGGLAGLTALDSGAGFGLHNPAQRPGGMTWVRRLAGPPQPRSFTPNRSPAPGQTPPGDRARPDRRPGRSRARLSRLLPAFALLLGALSLFGAAPAMAQTPVVQWAQTAYSVTETDADQSLDLTISINPVIPGPNNRGIIVFVLGTGTATQPDDWDFSAACVSIPHSASTATCTLTIKGDDIYEGSETIELELRPVSSAYNLGSNTRTTVTIIDDETPTYVLSVDATPACGSTVTDTSVKPSRSLVLTPAPGENVEAEYRWVTDSTTGQWQAALPIEPGGRSVRTSFGTFAQLRQAYDGFAGFEYRLKDTPSVTAQCTWQFQGGDDDGDGDDDRDDDDRGDGDGGDGDGGNDDGDDDSGSEPENRPPTVTLSCAPCEVEMEGEAMLTASASDPDDDPLTYTWTASAGVIAEMADPVTARWTAPDQIGTVTIGVEVSDGEGGTAAAEITVDVLVAVPEQMSFDIPDRGAATSSTGGEADSPRTGYGRIRPDGGMATPSGIALFQFRDPEGVLITETSVPAAAPILQGRIFAEAGGAVVTALAFANPNDRPSEVSFYVTDTAGKRVKEGRFTLEAQRHLAGLLNAAPFEVDNVVGTFTFTASAPVAVIALRGVTNEAGEWVATTLPVGLVLAPPGLFSDTSTDPVLFPHFAAGGGWSTEVILVNPTRVPIEGRLEFRGPDAAPLTVTLADGQMGSSFPYAIAADSAQRFTTANPAGGTASGSVRATPDNNTAAPSGLLVFSFAEGGKTVSVAGVHTVDPSTAFRVPIAAAGMPGRPGSLRTGLAIANATDAETGVVLEITRPDGLLVPPLGSLTLPPGGQTARMLDEIIDLPQNFSSGLLRVSASNGEVAVVAVRIRINARGELKASSLWPQDETAPATTRDRYFAHLADTGGWTTELILYSGTAGETASGTLSLFWFPAE